MVELDRLRVAPGTAPDLAGRDPADRLGLPDDDTARELVRDLQDDLVRLQYRLEAEAERAVLLVLQAMPAAGKDETIRAALRGLNPQAYRTVHFGQANDEERAHDHLWRFHHRTPAMGTIGVFNRSQLEGVVSDRVEERVPEERWRRRYGHIRDFERLLTDEGTTLVKVFLHVSLEEETRRLRGRAEDPERRWELDLHDLDIIERHDAFREAYEDAIRETSTEHAPWHVVPSDVPIVRDAAVLSVLRAALRELDPQVPTDALDDDELAEVRKRLGDGPTSDPASELDRAR